jgi:sortase A
VRHDDTIDPPRVLAADQGADLAAFYDRRAAAALAYCSRLCAPEAIADAVEAAFARVFDAAAAGERLDDDALDARLRSAVRSESARRASAATAGMPARRLLERLADSNRGGACNLMPALLAARAEGALSDADVDRMQQHLRRCAECRTAEQRFDEAERSFDALATEDAPALGRSLLSEMLADSEPAERGRFARERIADPPEWLDELEWAAAPPRVVPVPDDALEPAVREPEADEQDERAEEAEPPRQPRDPAVTSADTVDFPAPRRGLQLGPRARRRLVVSLLVVASLLLSEAALTVLWKEPFTAFLTARAQNDLTQQLGKRDSAPIEGADADRLASIEDVDARTKARLDLLAGREADAVPEGDALGLLSIDEIGLETVVVEGTESATLRKGPGHYDETALPGEGRPVGIAGHRTTYDAPFRKLDDLEPGDEITIKMSYGLFTYSVTRERIVPADFKDAFAGSVEELVLSACHPLYSASERILVYAKLESVQPLGGGVEDADAAPTDRELAEERRAAALEALGDRQLMEGMTGPDVKELQRLLGLPQTGTYGPETTAAVSEFQSEHGLPVVGQVGSQTKDALARRPRPPSRPPTPPPVPQQQVPEQGQTAAPPGTATQP